MTRKHHHKPLSDTTTTITTNHATYRTNTRFNTPPTTQHNATNHNGTQPPNTTTLRQRNLKFEQWFDLETRLFFCTWQFLNNFCSTIFQRVTNSHDQSQQRISNRVLSLFTFEKVMGIDNAWYLWWNVDWWWNRLEMCRGGAAVWSGEADECMIIWCRGVVTIPVRVTKVNAREGVMQWEWRDWMIVGAVSEELCHCGVLLSGNSVWCSAGMRGWSGGSGDVVWWGSVRWSMCDQWAMMKWEWCWHDDDDRYGTWWWSVGTGSDIPLCSRERWVISMLFRRLCRRCEV